jgi:hypothetical protein
MESAATAPRPGYVSRSRWQALVVAGVTVIGAACSADSAPQPAADAPVTFEQAAGTAGFDVVQAAKRFDSNCFFQWVSPGPTACENERWSGGVAVGDVDGDGRDDVLFSNLDGPVRVYLNNGDGTFADATESSGLGGFSVRSNGLGLADIDNDGDLDVMVTTMATDRYYLFVNNGDGTFTEQAEARGVALAGTELRSGFSVAFGDYDNDGWIDMHLTEWLPRAAQSPDVVSHARLLRNRGAADPGVFDDVTDAAGVALGLTVTDSLGTSQVAPPVYSFASALTDLDADGWPDLVVTSDYGTSQLFWNNGDGTFTEGTAAARFGSEGHGMGLAIGDVNGDGRPDIFVTSISNRASSCGGRPCDPGLTGNRLYVNLGDRRFDEVNDRAGVTIGYWGWGAAMPDIDNDGLTDIVMTNGVDLDGDEEYLAAHGQYRLNPKQLWINNGDGTFTDIARTAGINIAEPGTGLAVFDATGNGHLDIIMVHPAMTPTLWRNNATTNNWLRIKAIGTDSNRDAIGAVVTVTTDDGTTQTRTIGANSHYLGQSEHTAHFGLANRTPTRVEVWFPTTNRRATVTGPDTNTTITITEPES